MRIFKNIAQLTNKDILLLSQALLTNDYKYILKEPDAFNIPDGIYDHLLTADTYKYIFDDEGAYCNFYFLEFNSSSNTPIYLPIGSFGVSPKHKLTYPIIIGSIFTNFFMQTQDDFCMLVKIKDTDEKKRRFQDLVALRSEMMQIVFDFYATAHKGYNAIIGWPKRGEKSLARIVAEKSYTRVQVDDYEFFHKHNLSDTVMDVLIESNKRLRILTSRQPKKQPVRKEGKLKHFLSVHIRLLDYINTRRTTQRLRLFYTIVSKIKNQ